MTNDIATDLAGLLARAGILMFSYDPDGYLLSATGSCLGGGDAALEVRAGLVTPGVVRRAALGERVVECVHIGEREVAVVHEPVLNERGGVERILATAFPVQATTRPETAPALLLAS